MLLHMLFALLKIKIKCFLNQISLKNHYWNCNEVELMYLISVLFILSLSFKDNAN